MQAFGQTPTGLQPLAQVFYDSAVQLEEADQPAAAALRWQKVVELDPTWTQGWCRLGDAWASAGRLEAAHRAWRQGAFDPRCVEAQGRAWLEEHPEWSLQRFETLASLTSQEPFTDLLLARALARIHPAKGLEALERYLEREGSPSEELLLAAREVAAVLEPDEALQILQRVSNLDESLASPIAEEVLALEVEVRAEELEGAAPERLSDAQRRALATARSHFGAGRVEEARVALETLVDQVARNPEVWATLADVREVQGDLAGAEAALGLAKQLAPLSADVHARFAQFLTDHYAGRFDAEALDALERALDAGESPELLRRHAELALRLGRADQAARSLQLLTLEGDLDAVSQLADLERERPPPLTLPAVPPPPGVDPDAWRSLYRARVFEERARREDGWDPDLLARAVAEADQALKADVAPVLNQRAHLHALLDERGEAIDLYRRSLAQQPDQVEVLGTLAELLVLEGSSDAPAALAEAANAGNGWALVFLARQAMVDWRYLAARDHLERYVLANSSGPEFARATAMRTRIDQTLLAGVVVLALGALSLLALPVWWVRRRRAGVAVETFLDDQPRAVPEAVRILSSVRHEVLKHSISSLPALAERLDAGDERAVDWAERRLFGEGAALERFADYLDQLEGLARRYGVQLNLRYRDPLFSDAIGAMHAIGRLRGRLGPGAASALTAQAERLNGPVYEGLGQLIQSASLVRLDEAVVRAAWSTVVTERSDDGLSLGFEVVGDVTGLLRIARSDLHDILVNLLRNAVDASIAESRDAIAVVVGRDEDFITGLVRAEIRVCDQVEKRLTTAMIRGRYIDRGLGLAVDLTSRSGGSIHVEAQDGWAKAVVVRLPKGETG